MRRPGDAWHRHGAEKQPANTVSQPALTRAGVSLAALRRVVLAAKSGKSSVVDVVSMATARLCKAKVCHASVFAAHDLGVARFRKQAMSASEYQQKRKRPTLAKVQSLASFDRPRSEEENGWRRRFSSPPPKSSPMRRLSAVRPSV
jgi:hypothetical protein